MRRPLITAILAAITVAAVPFIARASSAEACAGLIGSNGAVNLERTSTLAGYHNGVEHYVTAFKFQGSGGEFGSLIPLPGVPTKVERGGGWTLQRLDRETQQFNLGFAAAESLDDSAKRAEVLQEVRIDALDITILKGGAPAIAAWAGEHGFRLSPDAPEVLDFYAARSPIFLAAVFDGKAAAVRGQALGDGTPVHLTIPTDDPWVPLRILGLGKAPEDRVDADVYLLTDRKPALLPAPGPGLDLLHSDPATDLLLSDLRTDDGGSWVPEKAWLTKLAVNTTAADLKFDLAIEASGFGQPSRVAAGLELPDFVPTVLPLERSASPVGWTLIVLAALLLTAMAAVTLRPSVARTWTDRRD